MSGYWWLTRVRSLLMGPAPAVWSVAVRAKPEPVAATRAAVAE
jgi:hypothetical protein